MEGLQEESRIETTNTGFGRANRETSLGAVQDRNSALEFTPKPFFPSLIFRLEDPTERSLGSLCSVFNIQSRFIVSLSPSQCNIEDLVSRYIDSANTRVKSMEEIERSQKASMHSMESQIGLLARMIARISEEQAEVITVLSANELEIMAHIIVDEEEQINPVLEESTAL
ncbi:hypothetical protein M9H77_03075 [Catharanthus roseus]|uniref:Uncharacterized protein n=1 Tax=Catharanthus roseus TaxID=4058 RepID=A0ACC0CA67_CATRO|nr:hypothetical protein M9H77_03075 [Catharanthus roseus]